MNLTDFEQTPIHRVFEAVKREAARYGVFRSAVRSLASSPRKLWSRPQSGSCRLKTSIRR